MAYTFSGIVESTAKIQGNLFAEKIAWKRKQTNKFKARPDNFLRP